MGIISLNINCLNKKNLDLGFLICFNILLLCKEPEKLVLIEINGIKYISIES